MSYFQARNAVADRARGLNGVGLATSFEAQKSLETTDDLVCVSQDTPDAESRPDSASLPNSIAKRRSTSVIGTIHRRVTALPRTLGRVTSGPEGGAAASRIAVKEVPVNASHVTVCPLPSLDLLPRAGRTIPRCPEFVGATDALSQHIVAGEWPAKRAFLHAIACVTSEAIRPTPGWDHSDWITVLQEGRSISLFEPDDAEATLRK